MSRSIGLTRALTDLPDAVVLGFALVTQLGDFWFVFSLTALAYWLGPHAPRVGRGLTRERAAMVVALLVAAVALTVSLKAVFGLPRPAGAGVAPETRLVPPGLQGLYVWMATGEGYGFPSGHATVAVLVWGGFAWAVRVGTARKRAVVAGAVVALVALSRLVLGVHFAVDVVAGGVLAGGVLWLALTGLKRPEYVFALSAVVAMAGLTAGGLTPDIGAAVGMSVAGGLAWTALPATPTPTRWSAFTTAALGLLTVGVMAAVALFVLADGLTVMLFAAVGTVLLLAMPLAGERLAKKA